MDIPYSLSEASARYDDALAMRIDKKEDIEEKPIIGVTTNLGDKGAEMAVVYYDSVRRAGGVPLLLPPTDDPQEVIAQLEQIDGLLLTGGADVNPLWMGEEPWPEVHGINPKRDLYEIQLCRLAHQRNIPILGICRGCQVMAIALGGKVTQDIKREKELRHRDNPNPLYLVKHSQDAPRNEATHRVTFTDTDGAFAACGVFDVVNSFHHQAILDPGPLMHVSAVAEDNVIEAVEENSGESLLLGVQWHPECMPESSLCQRVFEYFVDAAHSYCRALELHSRINTLDSHCDTPMMFPRMIEAQEEKQHYKVDMEEWEPDLIHRNPHCLVDMVKAAEGHLDEAYMVSYIPQGPRTPEGFNAAREQVEQTFNRLWGFHKNHNYPLYIHFGIENGYALGKDISLIEYYKNHYSVEYITLVHNGHNDICDSARPKQGEPQEEWGGLSPFGVQVVEEMNRQGVLIDLSHASEKTFYQVLELSTKPVAVTHACCRALCDHPRNLTDDQLRAIAEKGGVVQCTMYPGFLRQDGDPTIFHFMQHLLHMIEVAGIDHVGIGSDFDGDGGVPGLRDASDMMHITECLISQDFSDNDICKIWGDNFRRVLAAQSL